MIARFAAAFVVLCGGLFVLPYLVPPTSTILSASYLAGYNNSLAYAVYVALMLVGGLWVSARLSGGRVRAALELDGPLFVAPPLAVVALMLAHVALFAGLYVKAHGFTFGEPLYFQDAAYRARAGAIPFVDFYFFYGPLFVSPVAFLARFVGMFPAYALYYFATYVAGLYLLYAVVAAFTRQRGTLLWYAIFAIGLFNPITGLNYTFVRFMLPIVTLLATWRCYQQLDARRWIVAVSLFTVAVLSSPDLAVVTVAATAVLGIMLIWVETLRGVLTASAAALAAIPVTALVLSCAAMLLIDGTWRPIAAYMTPVLTFSAGGWSTPIDPNLPMLSLVIATLLASSLIWSAWRESNGTPMSALLVAFGALILLMQRASLGKADVQHIAFSGLPAFLAAAAWMSSSRGRARSQQWLAALIVVGVVLPLQFYHAMLFVPSLLQKWTSPASVAATPTNTPRPATKAEVQASIEQMVQKFGTDRLYYMHRLEYFRLPVYLQHNLKPFMYQPTLASAFTSKDIDDVIAQLRNNDVLVLARRSDLTVTTPVTPLPTHWWFYATSSPLPGSQIFNLTLEFQARLEAPLVTFLNTQYDIVFEDGDVVALVRRAL